MGTSLALGDTSVFIAVENNRPLRTEPPQRLVVSMITVGELRAGVLSALDSPTRAERLRSLAKAMEVEPLPVDDHVATAWAELRIRLRESGRRLGANDSWIAATAIAHDLPLVTQDRDYDGVPGLTVVAL
ncbi:type II toxin-antitoxin system VapC family toxin [Pseudonocardia aurantiaca]|uniref:Ribonuclease VapC n=1 Tax=Pseudonocardia aurantiaca TaxID=75290 RepID=A0ABW4FQ78_9PSEU